MHTAHTSRHIYTYTTVVPCWLIISILSPHQCQNGIDILLCSNKNSTFISLTYLLEEWELRRTPMPMHHLTLVNSPWKISRLVLGFVWITKHWISTNFHLLIFTGNFSWCFLYWDYQEVINLVGRKSFYN